MRELEEEDVGTYDADEEEKAETAQQGMRFVYLQSALELVLESVPQAVLQTYIGVSYGEFALSSEKFSPVLALSVFCSFLASGVHHPAKTHWLSVSLSVCLWLSLRVRVRVCMLHTFVRSR